MNLNLKPFNLELAKKGYPVCTMDGHEVRIICFDKKDKHYPIVALVKWETKEDVHSYTNDGCNSSLGFKSMLDLVMKSIKKEGWVNIYKDEFKTWADTEIFSTKEEAIGYNEVSTYVSKEKYIDTVKIEWEE